MITPCGQANENESKQMINRSNRHSTDQAHKGATKEAIHGNCHVAYQTDDCCGPQDRMVALADDWDNDWSQTTGLMLFECGEANAMGDDGG